MQDTHAATCGQAEITSYQAVNAWQIVSASCRRLCCHNKEFDLKDLKETRDRLCAACDANKQRHSRAQEADELAGRQRQFADAKQRLLNERKGLEMAQEALEASLAEVRSYPEAPVSASGSTEAVMCHSEDWWHLSSAPKASWLCHCCLARTSAQRG